jgi:hypothetical protein
MGGIQRPVSGVANSSSDKTQKDNFHQWIEKKCWERFAALSYPAGTSLATILRSFATMVRWRKTSLRPSPRWNRTDRFGDYDQLGRPGGDSQDLRAGAGEAHGGAKTEGGADAVLESKIEELKAKHSYFETVAARLEALELRQNPLCR